MEASYLIFSSAVGPIGFGLTGGVEVTLASIVSALLQDKKSRVAIMAHHDSIINIERCEFIPVKGTCPSPMQIQETQNTKLISSLVLNMLSKAHQIQDQYNVIINLSYDHLIYWATDLFTTPIVHLVSMCNEDLSIAKLVVDLFNKNSKAIAFHTAAQMNTYHIQSAELLYNGFDPADYKFYSQAEPGLVWAGRISPEKGLEDALDISIELEIPLTVIGKATDTHYHENLQRKYKNSLINWMGYLEHQKFKRNLGRWQAMIFTPKWSEAMGNCIIEAVMCGIPVISYDRGGIKEIIDEGKTGYVVNNGDRHKLKLGIKNALKLSRKQVREHAIKKFSHETFRQRLFNWLRHSL